MRAHRDSDIGQSRWSLLAMIVALLLCLSPAAAMGQGIKDAVNDDSATEEATEEPFDPATEEATEEPFDPVEQSSEWEDAGLIDDQSYESPQFGYTIDWSADWAVDVFYDQPDEDIQPVMSNEDIEQDIIYLVWSGGPNEEAYAIYSGQTDNRGGPAGEVEEWTDPGYIESAWDANLEVEVLLDDTTRTSAAVLYSVEDLEDPAGVIYYTLYQAIELEDGTTLYLTFSASEDVAEAAYASWSEDVEIDGEPLDVVFDWSDIEAAI